MTVKKVNVRSGPKKSGSLEVDPQEGKPCRVVFWDGIHIGPCIETSNDNLEERLRSLLNKHAAGMSCSRTAAMFVALSVAKGYTTALHNLPHPDRAGAAIAFMQRFEFWPKRGKELLGGVFLVNTDTGGCEYWGGDGLVPGEQKDPSSPRAAMLKEVQFEDGTVDQDGGEGAEAHD